MTNAATKVYTRHIFPQCARLCDKYSKIMQKDSKLTMLNY